MKVVINASIGGFGLSRKAQKEINKIGCEHSEWVDENEYFSGEDDSTIKIWGSIEEARKSHCDLCEMLRENGKILVDEHRSIYKNPKVRVCPVLVQVVEQMGKKANGQHAELKIVEVPEEIEWTIEEYDGSEWVAEKHRIWS